MYNETQLQAIRLFGDKTLLSFGCIINHANYGIGKLIRKWDIDSYWKGGQEFLGEDGNMRLLQGGFEILGHEPHLFPDVARVAKEKNIFLEIQKSRYSKTEYTLNFSRGNDTPMLSLDFEPTLPFINQPHLSEIVNLFCK